MPAQISKTAELIAGYTLQERIGSGGYGEVWRAEAPGGLLKAIKFIYGRFDEERASCELKALHRIKEVRHPFLLSLERIEVIDGQLVIVTELADASLSDRYEVCKAANLPGIPRDELLLYLHDAADALDYMSEHFQLQHLDIKPENLLIVGGRVKVADFGLVKDIQDVTVSLMGGLTPVYAAPEVFEGHPSLNSDQYSLAIVYQEMLTGLLPFPGKTVAQLTSQHLHGNPRLIPVPPADRPILAKSLDKDAQQRFGSCRSLIEALQKAVNEESSPAALRPAHTPTREITPTITLSNAESSCDTEAKSSPPRQHPGDAEQEVELLSSLQDLSAAGYPASTSECVPSAYESKEREHSDSAVVCQPNDYADLASEPLPLAFENLPGFEQDFSETKLRPTFLIGIGGASGLVLKKMQRRLCEQFENMENIPIFQSLYIDTDPQSFDKLKSSDQDSRLIHKEYLPLRKPEEYKEKSEQLMRWLGHRWLYNIPRSLQTEGLRPLGRLALVDNADKAMLRIRNILKTITAPDSMKAASLQSNMPIEESTPLIYIIASISGGTGSGMILDMAYAVRQALLREGIKSAKICGILLHGTSRHTAEKTLSIANSYACLVELRAYQSRYPGEKTAGIPAEKGCGPFDDTYFMHLGDDLDDAQFEDATDKIAEYVFLDTTSACRGFFEQCRKPSPAADLALGKETVRSMGLSRLGFTPKDIPAPEIKSLCRNLVDRWRQPLRNAATLKLAASASSLNSLPNGNKPANPIQNPCTNSPTKATVDFNALDGKVRNIVHEIILDRDSDVLPRTSGSQCCIELPADASDTTAERVQRSLDTLMVSVQSLTENGLASSSLVDETIVARLKSFVAAEAELLRNQLVEEFNHLESCLSDVQKTCDDIISNIREKDRDVHSRLESLRETLAKVEKLFMREVAEKKSWFGNLFSGKNPARSMATWNDYAGKRLELIVLQVQKTTWSSLSNCLTVFNDQLRDMREELQTITREFQPNAGVSNEPAEIIENEAVQLLTKITWQSMFRKHKQALVRHLDQCLRHTLTECLKDAGSRKSRTILTSDYAESLRQSVRSELSKLMRQIDLTGHVITSNVQQPDAPSPFKPIIELAQSPLYSVCGGAQRLLLACTKGTSPASLKKTFETDAELSVNIARTASPEMVFCYEIERIPISRIVTHLLDNHDECRSIASKLHTRNDVSWPRGL